MKDQYEEDQQRQSNYWVKKENNLIFGVRVCGGLMTTSGVIPQAPSTCCNRISLVIDVNH